MVQWLVNGARVVPVWLRPPSNEDGQSQSPARFTLREPPFLTRRDGYRWGWYKRETPFIRK